MSFRRPLLSVDVSVLCVGNFDAKYLANEAMYGYVSKSDPIGKCLRCIDSGHHR